MRRKISTPFGQYNFNQRNQIYKLSTLGPFCLLCFLAVLPLNSLPTHHNCFFSRTYSFDEIIQDLPLLPALVLSLFFLPFFFFLFFTFASPWMDGHDRRVSERSTLPFIKLVTFFRVNVPSSFEASHCGSCASLHVARSRPARESNLARIFLPLVEGRIYERTPTQRGTRAPRHSDTTDTTVHALLLLCLPSSRRIKGRLSCLSITSLPLHLLTFLFFCSIF